MKKYTYDLFISHAFEDKNDFANELALELKRKGIRVWYSGFELTIGTSISSSINKALLESEYGLVLISPTYLEKAWAMKELETLFAVEDQRKRILPVLHKISINELRNKLPVLADRYAILSSKGIAYIVDRIIEVVQAQPKATHSIAAKKKKKKRKKPMPEQQNAIQAGVSISNSNNANIGNVAGGNINSIHLH
ncbi:MAG: toll/interleukin-1 receptor domain-containing protein [Bacteroidia bacterium]